MKQLWLKIFALALALTMLLSVTSCAMPDDTAESTTSGSPAAEETTTESPDEETTETADLTTETVDETALSVPDDLKLNDEISILCWNDAAICSEFANDGLVGDYVDDSVYWRDKQAKEQLGITFRWTRIAGNANNIEAFSDFVETSYEANNRFYDLIATYSKTMGLMSTKGFLTDLNTIENSYLDFSKEWWPSNLVQDVSVGDALYFVTGDISVSVLLRMHVIFYNHALGTELNLEDPRALVHDGNWTLAKFMEMSSGVYMDTDADGKRSDGDTYGFIAEYSYLDQFYIGSGLSTVEGSSDDIVKLSADVSSQKAHALVGLLQEILNGDGVFKIKTYMYDNPFFQGRALFANQYMGCFAYSPGDMADFPSHSLFFLPSPKYNTEQQSYFTTADNAISFWGIMSDVSVEEQTKLTAVLEVLAAFSYTYVTQEIFKSYGACKCLDGVEYNKAAASLMRICRKSIVFDRGRILSSSDTNGVVQLFCDAVYNETSWDNAVENANTSIRAKLESLNKMYREIKA